MASDRIAERLSPAILRNARRVLGPERNPPAQRLFRRRSTRGGGGGVPRASRRHAPEAHRLLDGGTHNRAPLVARKRDAVLQNSVCDRSRNVVLPRSRDDFLRWRAVDRVARRRGNRAVHPGPRLTPIPDWMGWCRRGRRAPRYYRGTLEFCRILCR